MAVSHEQAILLVRRGIPKELNPTGGLVMLYIENLTTLRKIVRQTLLPITHDWNADKHNAVRLKLLVHIVQRLLPMGITADKLQEAANDIRRHIKPRERATILDEVFRVRRLEERYERDEVGKSKQIPIYYLLNGANINQMILLGSM
jgi:Protein of unknown function (DUF2841)